MRPTQPTPSVMPAHIHAAPSSGARATVLGPEHHHRTSGAAHRRPLATGMLGSAMLLGGALLPMPTPAAVSTAPLPTTALIALIGSQSAHAQQSPSPDDEDDEPPPEARESGDVDLETFYRELRPHGTWWDHPRYGRVWTPRGVDRDWKPYTRGHWARTEEHGWYWVAEEDWGWAPFHYGRWGFDEDEGWFWVPGTQWGPAWVVWRENDDVVGWAPLPPDAEWDRTSGLRFNSSDYNGTRWAFAWSFVEPQYMFLPGLYGRLAPRHRHTSYLRASRPIWSYTYRDRRVVNGGLDWRRIERRIGQPVPTVRLAYVNDPRRSGWRSMQDPRSVPVYRPRVSVQPGDRRPDGRRNDSQWGWRPPTPADPRPGRDVVRPQGGFWGGRGSEPARVDPPRDTRRDGVRPGEGRTFDDRGRSYPGGIRTGEPPVSRPRDPINPTRGGTVVPPDRRFEPGRAPPPLQPRATTTPDRSVLPPPPPQQQPTGPRGWRPEGNEPPGRFGPRGGQTTQPVTAPPPATRQSPPVTAPPPATRQPPPGTPPVGTRPQQPPSGGVPPPGAGGPRGGGDGTRGDRPRGDGQRGERPRGERPPNQ